MKEVILYEIQGRTVEIVFTYSRKGYKWVCLAQITGFPVVGYGKQKDREKSRAISLSRLLTAYQNSIIDICI